MEPPQTYADYPRATPPPRVRLEVIGEAFQLFGQAPIQWMLCSIPFFLASVAYLTVYIGTSFAQAFSGREPSLSLIGFQLVGTVIYSFLYYLALAGLTNVALKQIRGEPFGFADSLSMRGRAPAVLMAILLIGLVSGVGFLLCCFPGMIALGGFMLAFPLMLDRGLGPAEAMRQSWNALRSQLVMAVLLYFVLAILMTTGIYLCGIGVLVGAPIFVLGITLVYRDLFMTSAQVGYEL
jgi:uncharacterized membrane protein